MTSRADQRREAMVVRQIRRRGITDPALLAAFRAVPREAFVPDDLQHLAYEDGPVPIGAGQTISQPYIVARMIDEVGVHAGMRVLEVGAGSGYAAAVMSRIAREVFAVERHESLACEARVRIETLEYHNCHVISGDGMVGLAEQAPFDAILVSAGADEVPDQLLRQLVVGGRMVIPVGGGCVQQLRCVERTGEDGWAWHDIAAVRFVPLLHGCVPTPETDGTAS